MHGLRCGVSGRVVVTGVAVWSLLAGATASPVLAAAASNSKVTGSVTYRERVALPPGAVVRVTLSDVSRADAAAEVIAERTVEPQHAVPVPFELEYDARVIDEQRTYAVRATIERNEHVLFTTDRAYHVLTRGSPAHVELVLVRSGGGTVPVADAELSGTRWVLRTLGEERVEHEGDEGPAFIQFDVDGARLLAFGNAGCNSFRGDFKVDGSSLTGGELASTLMACPRVESEQRFLAALQRVDRYEIRSTWLVLSGPDGRLATFEAWYE